MLVFRRPRTKQPAIPARVNWSNPLARGLEFAWYPGCSADVAGGALAELRDGSSAGVGKFGRHLASSASGFTNRGVQLSGGRSWDMGSAGTPLTAVVFLNYFNSSTNAAPAVQLMNGPAQIGLGIDVSSKFSLYRAGSATASSATVTLGAPFCFAATFRHGSSGGLYINGELDTPYTDDGRTGTGPVQSLLGSDGLTTTDAAISLALVFSRQLSDAEIREVYRNPWQLFTPFQPRLWAPTSASVAGVDMLAPRRPWTRQPQGPTPYASAWRSRAKPGILASISLGRTTTGTDVIQAVGSSASVISRDAGRFAALSATLLRSEYIDPDSATIEGRNVAMLAVIRTTATSQDAESIAALGSDSGTSGNTLFAIARLTATGNLGHLVGTASSNPGSWTDTGVNVSDGRAHTVLIRSSITPSGFTQDTSCFIDGVQAIGSSQTGGVGSLPYTYACAGGTRRTTDFVSTGSCEVAMVIPIIGAITDAEAISLSRNPWQIFAPLVRRYGFAAAAAAGVPFLSAAGASSITATTATPYVTVTF